jgi:cell division septal protein FtsQ
MPPDGTNLKSRSAAREKDDIVKGNSPATPGMQRGLRSLVWLLLVLLAVIVMMLAMWGRMHQNATSTVNPAKSQPSGIRR